MDHPGREMWMDGLLSVRPRSCLDGVLAGGVDTDFVACPMFRRLAMVLLGGQPVGS